MITTQLINPHSPHPHKLWIGRLWSAGVWAALLLTASATTLANESYGDQYHQAHSYVVDIDGSDDQITPLNTKASPSLSKLMEQKPKPEQKVIQIALIIDDLGYNLRLGKIAAKFPAALTLAVIPHSPNGKSLAELGHQRGKEIMLHTPMSNLQQLPLDEGGLTEEMLHDSFVETLHRGLESIPYVSGVNNHMGSYLTQLDEPMQWLMTELAAENLFFIDSRTSPNSVAHQIALDHNIASRNRDVFLDNERDEEYIAAQLAKLIRIARLRGSAIGIGHPHPETLSVLAKALPKLKAQGIEIISVSNLLQQYPATPTLPKLIGSAPATTKDTSATIH